MTDDDEHRGTTIRLCRLDVLHIRHVDHRRTDNARERRNLRNDQRDNQVIDAGAQRGRNGDSQQQRRDAHKDIQHAHDDGVHLAAIIGNDRAQKAGNGAGDDGGNKANL